MKTFNGLKRFRFLCLPLLCAALLLFASSALADRSGILGGLSWTLDTAGTLTVSGSGTMGSVSETDAWRPYSSEIRKVVLGDGVTSVAGWAFRDCAGLSDVTLPDSVASVGMGAFYGCSSLTAVTLPRGVTVVDSFTFFNCTSLSSVILPDGLVSVGGSAFSGCASLAGITVPSGATGIGAWAFNGCSSLASVSLPNSVTTIGAGAFAGCGSLSAFTVPSGVSSLGGNVFFNCVNLVSVRLPASVTHIDDAAFSDCSGLSLTLYPSAYLLDYAKSHSIPYTVYGVRRLTVPLRTAYIKAEAFAGTDCEAVYIPDGIQSIGPRAFANCPRLIYISLPCGFTAIDETAFQGSGNVYIDYRKSGSPSTPTDLPATSTDL